MSKFIPTDHIYSLVRGRLGPDATTEIVESVSRKVAALLENVETEAEPNDGATDTSATQLLLTITGLDTPEAADGLLAQLQSYRCQVLGSDRAATNGYFCLLVSLDVAGCSLSLAELATALGVTGEAEGLDVALKNVPASNLQSNLRS